MKKLTIFVVALAAIVPAIAGAAYFGSGSSVVLPGGQAADTNVYLAGGTVNVTNPVTGDLFAGGGTINISASVAKDIAAAGGTINLNNVSAEDLRVAGGNISINGTFRGEVMAGGGQITVGPGTTIAKDSNLYGGSITFAGIESGSLTIAGGEVHIDGTVNGNLLIRKANKVFIGPSGLVKGSFEYSAPEEVTFETGGRVVGATTYHKTEPVKNAAGNVFAGLITVWFVIKFFAVLAAAYLVWYLRRKDVLTIIESVHTKFWHDLLRGFAFFFLAPIAVVLLCLTVVGLIPAIVLLLAFIASLVLAAPVAILVAASLLARLFKRSRTDLRWYYILLIAVAFTLVSLIPFVGWIVGCVIYLISLGALVNVLRMKFVDR